VGLRFAPREVPGGDAADFVARSISSMPLAHEVQVRVHGPEAVVRELLRWVEADLVVDGPDSTLVHPRSDELGWLPTILPGRGSALGIELVDDPAGSAAAVRDLLRTIGGRFAATAGPTAASA